MIFYQHNSISVHWGAIELLNMINIIYDFVMTALETSEKWKKCLNWSPVSGLPISIVIIVTQLLNYF